MRFHKLTFFASLFLTLVMIFTALLFDYVHTSQEILKPTFLYKIIVSIFLIFFINYIVLNLLFATYGKKQIQKMSNFLPDDLQAQNETLNFQQLGERIIDLTEKNATEVSLLKEMEIYRKDYVGNVSHELKTPLFSIQAYIATLVDGGVEDLNIRDKYLERIDKSVERLLSIVKDLDMINQYESGQISLNISEFDINSIIRETIDLLDFEAQKKQSKVSLQNSQAIILVKADKQKISQVLINLLSNAIHYSNREKAQITIKTNVLKRKVLVEVSDNGMGIKPELLPRIFERFYRVESSRNRQNGGSGLGLAIVKHILEAHQEKIHVESTYLEGTTFSFLLDLV
ncbi:two-component system, OmpR family, phosphate regulon sensor histidine kinase PhoR [Halpernia humi]|uniref:histidine kinase n=1 Tax=Halpernia humi TaxID=493375 RepID=A0A1H5YRZ8_9FLAO|nr:two-component system, OmpR family, phosphate regulon sensor histidine kinase PhoR [Halpernia humi]